MNLRYLILNVLFFLVVLATTAQKIDTIYHINGNTLTGDFKKLVYGVVTYKMDGMGTVSLETPKINSFRSIKRFDVRLKNGSRYYCSFDSSAYERKVNMLLSNGKKLVDIDDVVQIYPIKKSFWLRTSGNFGLGFNYSKGSNLATIDINGRLDYRKRNSSFYFSWDNYDTFQADTISSTKVDSRLGWTRFLRSKWSAGTNIGMTQNSELGTKLRLDIAVVGLYDFVFNQWNRLYAAGGISLQRETPYDASENIEDVVGVLSLSWKVYRLTNPKVWVDSDVSFIPYFTTEGRYRINMNFNPKISIVGNDLKLGFKFYYSYDSQPPTATAAKDDWGLSLEVSYYFH
ncbi:MAG: hypothetical protein DRI95_15625 [Bacteroidetes bacterium]|nr:MAG: hypothetical protein DRI95_15625 [Bacteroidota bacterium]RLD79961.1 MAG: hypothetical protein DRJ07_11055 [Bacteroidota bacterium]